MCDFSTNCWCGQGLGEQSPQRAHLPPSGPQHVSKLTMSGVCNFPSVQCGKNFAHWSGWAGRLGGAGQVCSECTAEQLSRAPFLPQPVWDSGLDTALPLISTPVVAGPVIWGRQRSWPHQSPFAFVGTGASDGSESRMRQVLLPRNPGLRQCWPVLLFSAPFLPREDTLQQARWLGISLGWPKSLFGLFSIRWYRKTQTNF